MRRTWAIAGLVVALALVGYALLAPRSDDEQIRARLEELAQLVSYQKGDAQEVARGLELQRGIHDLFTKDSLTRIPDLSSPELDRAGVVELALGSIRGYDLIDLGFAQIRVRLAGDELASSECDATLALGQHGALDRDTRPVTIAWRKIDGEWRIQTLDVADRDRAYPEARP